MIRQHQILPIRLISVMLAAAFVLLSSVACTGVDIKDDAYIDGSQIFYSGEIEAGRNQRLFALFEQADPKPTVLNIFSTGGPIVLGLELGEWVLRKGLDVNIPTLCVSACANYVFTTGRNVVLGEKALVYWHGSPIIDDLVEGTAQEKSRWVEVQSALRESGFDGEDPGAYWRSVRSRNRRLFRAAGISPLITVPQTLAVSDSRRDIDKFGDYKNWGLYLSVKDMKYFGRDKVFIAGAQKWQPELSPYHVEGILRMQLAHNFSDRMKQLNKRIARVTY